MLIGLFAGTQRQATTSSTQTKCSPSLISLILGLEPTSSTIRTTPRREFRRLLPEAVSRSGIMRNWDPRQSEHAFSMFSKGAELMELADYVI